MAHQEFDNALPFHRPWQVDYDLAAATAGPVELKTVRSTSHRLYIRHISVTPSTYAARTITFQDDAGSPIPIGIVSIPAAAPTGGGNVQYIFDFKDSGTPLTAGTSLDMVLSAAGVAARVHIEGYEVINTTMAIGTNN